MTPLIYTQSVNGYIKMEIIMLAQTGKRITTRVSNHVQDKLQMAADLLGSTLNQFVVQAALEKADKIIESESTIILSKRESLRILDLIENPPPRNEKFNKAMERYQGMKKNALYPSE